MVSHVCDHQGVDCYSLSDSRNFLILWNFGIYVSYAINIVDTGIVINIVSIVIINIVSIIIGIIINDSINNTVRYERLKRTT